MYLKSIEVQGFKSFANKIIFEFNKGITAIVGPNGSGKSNVADAVRWVLGEQSAKQLRGTKMEDVIFSGTETRKALGFAYVALTLDNSDGKIHIEYPEVVVARRVYRSGESEYLINGHRSRLKEVQELFMDTGIGKEGYSIIGQGQIDQILSGKAEERRELFDEAVGIVKFKKRKALAEKQLADEKQSLYRIHDIIAEIEEQVEPLKEQSEVAKEYLKYRDELREYEINVFLQEMDNVQEALHDIENKFVSATGELEEVNVKLSNVKIEYDHIENREEIITSKIEELRNKKNADILAQEKLEGESNLLNEQIHHSKTNIEHFSLRLQNIEQEIEDKTLKKEEYIKEKLRLDEELDAIDSEQVDVENALKMIMLTVSSNTSSLEQNNAIIMDILHEKADVKVELQKHDTMLEQANVRKAELIQKLFKSKSVEEENKETIQELELELTQYQEEIKEIEDKNRNNISNQQERQQQLNQSTFELDQLQKEYHQNKSKLDALINITERYDGYGNSIKKIMELKDVNKGIIGVVADIVDVDKEYEVAIETAFGGSIQNIVTDNENTAKDLIQYLKNNRYGRATFLPLTTITNKVSLHNEDVLKEEGVIGLASTLVKTDSKYHTLIDYLLGRIVVAKDIHVALGIAKKYKYSLRIVTLGGESLSPGGSMTGGAFRNTSNLLGRQREMEELSKCIDNIKMKQTSCMKQIEKTKDDISKNNKIFEENKVILQEKYIIYSRVEESLKQKKMRTNEFSSELEQIQKEEKEIMIQIKQIKDGKATFEHKLVELDNKHSESEQQVQRLSKLGQRDSDKVESYRRSIEGLRLKFSECEQKTNFVLQNIKEIKSSIEKLTGELQILKEDIEKNKNEIHTREKQIQHILDNIKSMKNICILEENELEEAIKSKEKLLKTKKELFRQREELSGNSNLLDKEIYRLSAQKEKLQESIETQILYMQEEYEMTYNNALGLKNLEFGDLSTMKKTAALLKSKMKELGSVNINAIEEYKIKSERYNFLKQQRDDLIEAEENLKGIIEELNTSMREQFQTKFTEIQFHFDRVFKILFGGGKGTLELNEDEDILEAGIKIVAQPPGKKLQNMMQLSGGEKALTAIALLFSIQGLKPSPFCLLDEIEAALDESNVARFARYLNNLTNDTQFIIITHRKGTMEAADALYGITMQEKGISTLVSVNLIDEKHLK